MIKGFVHVSTVFVFIFTVVLSQMAKAQDDTSDVSKATLSSSSLPIDKDAQQHHPSAMDSELIGEYSTFDVIFGSFEQGAMIYARTQAGNKVKVLDRAVYVDGEGYFVFGLGRDAKPELTINITKKTGETVQVSHSVRQRKYKIQKIEGVAKKYVSPPEDVSKRIREENSAIAKARSADTKVRHFANGFIWPAKGPITGVYGSQRVFNGVPKRPHYGLDIAGPIGAPVVAPAAGIVMLAENDLYYSGGTLIMDHGQGVSSTFIHLSKILVKPGDQIKQGQNIAEIGATGRVTGPHLDWRINWFKQRLDPRLLLPE